MMKKVLQSICLIIILIAIPMAFNVIFHGDSVSYFFDIKSSISVSDWFSFWISYISTIASSILAYVAIELTNTIELSHKYDEAERNKLLLSFKDFTLKEGLGEFYENKEYSICATLSYESQCLKNLNAKDIRIFFEDDSFIELDLNSINGVNVLLLPKIADKDGFEKLLKWKLWNTSMSQGYESVKVSITYIYCLDSFRKKRRKKYLCTTKVESKIKAEDIETGNTQIMDMMANVVEIKKIREGKQI